MGCILGLWGVGIGRQTFNGRWVKIGKPIVRFVSKVK